MDIQKHSPVSIRMILGTKVILDRDLAPLYGVSTKRLNEAVRRHLDRFPPDFMFRLTAEQWKSLRSQYATLEKGRGKYSKYPPLAFTEQGVAMLSSVIQSNRAVQVNISIMRAFVRLRQIISEHKDLLVRLKRLESKYDRRFRVVFDAIRRLMETSEPRKKGIGFKTNASPPGLLP